MVLHLLKEARRIWDKYGFEIMIGLSIVFFLLYAIIRWKKKGTWSKRVFYTKTKSKGKGTKKAPTESRGEKECRRVLQNIFNEPFPKIRPDFLRNPIGTGMNMEIDCYNSRLKLGCEYHGQQHSKYIPFFHKTKADFQNQKYRDELKRRMCRENGIKLIEVYHTVKVEDIENHIKNKLKQMGYM